MHPDMADTKNLCLRADVFNGHVGCSDIPATEGHLDSMPSHPLGVKPSGNRYLSNGSDARANIGLWVVVPDELLMIVLEQFQQLELQVLGSTCKFLYAFCRADELWKSIYVGLPKEQSRAMPWRGSWRRTVLALPEELQSSVACTNIFSDVLHRPFACTNINLSQFANDIPPLHQIQRLSNLSYNEYAQKWTERPFILTECIKDWPVCSQWSMSTLLEAYGHLEFRAEAVDWTLKQYCSYMDNNMDESPLYLFDRTFAEKTGIEVGNGPGVAYWRPDCFGPDLFAVLGDDRPAHRWLIIGPERSGSTFHKDPNGTSAWNAVIQGSKYWIMFPPTAQVPGVYVSRDKSEVTSPLSIAEWLLTFHKEARRLPECVEGICRAGEILHVPSDWWHLVVNLERGIALTQNFVPQSPDLGLLSKVLLFLRDKPSQVSGFARSISDPYKLFTARLQQEQPSLLEKALAIAERAQDKKRKWDDVVGRDKKECQEDGVTGFSFGFGVDDDNDQTAADTR